MTEKMKLKSEVNEVEYLKRISRLECSLYQQKKLYRILYEKKEQIKAEKHFLSFLYGKAGKKKKQLLEAVLFELEKRYLFTGDVLGKLYDMNILKAEFRSLKAACRIYKEIKEQNCGSIGEACLLYKHQLQYEDTGNQQIILQLNQRAEAFAEKIIAWVQRLENPSEQSEMKQYFYQITEENKGHLIWLESYRNQDHR